MAMITEIKDIKTGNGKSIGQVIDYLEGEIEETVGYFSKDEDKKVVESEWKGEGAKHLGLEGSIDIEMLKNVLEGKHPTQPDTIFRKQSENGTDTNLCGFDMPFTCSKELSIAIIQADDTQRAELIRLDNEAIDFTLKWLEKNVDARTGPQGSVLKKTEGLICAKYRHFEARPSAATDMSDPHVHSHVVIANVGIWKDESGKVHYNTLDTAAFAKLRMEASSIYSMRQAENLQKAGYKLERFGEDNKFLRLEGIDPIGVDSKNNRSKEIIAAANGIKSAERQSQKNTRQDKKTFGSFSELQAETLDGLDKYGITESSIKSLKTDSIEYIKNDIDPVKVLKSLVDKEALFTETQLRTHFNIKMSGVGLSYDEIQNICKKTAEKEMIFVKREKNQDFYALKSTLKTEYEFLNSLKKSQGVNGKWKMSKMDIQKAIFDFEKVKGFSLTAEQKNALVSSMSSESSMSIWIGKAGAGKTTGLEVLKNLYDSKGFQIIGATPSGKATEGLIAAGIETFTNDRLLIDIKNGKTVLTAKTVIVMDEAGMVGVENFNAIKRLADAAGAKIYAVGDHNQLGAVSWGSAFYEASKIVGEDVSTLSEVRRQKNDKAKEVAQLYSNENIDAEQVKDSISMMIENDMIHTSENAIDAKIKLVNDVLEQAEDWKDKPVLAGTNRDCDDINTLIQDRLKKPDSVFTDEMIVKKNGVEKVRTFAAGDRFIFLEKATSKKVMEGSKTANNNDLGTIKSIIKNEGKAGYVFEVELDKGGVVKFDTSSENSMKSFDLGYSMTIHKSQGITSKVASVFLNGSEDKSKLYVALSRHQHGVKMYLEEKNMSVLNEVKEIQHKNFIYHEFNDKDTFFKAVINLDVQKVNDFVSINPDVAGFTDKSGKNAIERLVKMKVSQEDREAFKAVYKALDNAGCDKSQVNKVITPPPHILNTSESIYDVKSIHDVESIYDVEPLFEDVVEKVKVEEVKEVKTYTPTSKLQALRDKYNENSVDVVEKSQSEYVAERKAKEAEEKIENRFFDTIEYIQNGIENGTIDSENTTRDLMKKLVEYGFEEKDIIQDYKAVFSDVKSDLLQVATPEPAVAHVQARGMSM